MLLISSACSVQDDGSVVIAEHGIWAVVSGLSALFPEAVGRMMRKKKSALRELRSHKFLAAPDVFHVCIMEGLVAMLGIAVISWQLIWEVRIRFDKGQ